VFGIPRMEPDHDTGLMRDTADRSHSGEQCTHSRATPSPTLR
jgi:hypothetical protein